MTGRALAVFLGVTFGVSWGFAGGLYVMVPALAADPLISRIVFHVGVYAPAFGALAAARALGKEAFEDFLTRVKAIRVGWRWYAGVPVAFLLLHAAAAFATGGGGALSWPFASIGAALLALLLSPLADPGPVEEVGWRGFLQPLLQRSLDPVPAALIVGVIWGMWHLPVIVLPGFPQHNPDMPVWLAIARFVIQTCALSVLFALVLNATRGSVLIAALAHWAVNLPWSLGVVGDTMTAWTLLVALSAMIIVALRAASVIQTSRTKIMQRF